MEKEFIDIIKKTLNSPYIGDDCAYLKDLGVLISQDSLVEGVHFLRDKITPWQLGWKTANVNISDICAAGAEPKYITVALSLPVGIDKNFVMEFYSGLKSACCGIEVVGGDLTRSDKIYISATVLGVDSERNISSRASAKVGQKIVIAGMHGSSAVGLKLLLSGATEPQKLIKAHLEPIAQREFSKKIAIWQKTPYAMMDTSDGLMDVLFQISQASGVMMCVEFDKILIDDEIKGFENWRDLVLFGGEDYGLIATVDCPPQGVTVIGEVKQGLGVVVDDIYYPPEQINSLMFRHFEK